MVKNSETEISRWRAPISSAVTAGFGCGAGGLVFTGGLVSEGFDFRPCFAEGDFFDGFRIWRAPISTAVTAGFGYGALLSFILVMAPASGKAFIYFQF